MLYEFTNHFFAELGYQFFRAKVSSGKDRSFLADGTEAQTKLDRAKTERHGIFFGIGGAFQGNAPGLAE